MNITSSALPHVLGTGRPWLDLVDRLQLETTLGPLWRNDLAPRPRSSPSDCGLKTRGYVETEESLRNLVEAAKAARELLGAKA